MRTKTIELYSFDELSEEGKQKAIEKMYDINTDHEWYNFTFDDAKNIGLKITEFDIDRGNMIHGKLTQSAFAVATAILKEHGESCDTYKLAKEFLEHYTMDLKENELSDDTEETSFEINGKLYHEKLEEILEQNSDSFEESLLEEYLSILRKEYEYLSSEESIIETIQANEYEFTADGRLA